MLTLPAEITNNKNLISNKIIFFIDFLDLAYHLSSQDYELRKVSGTDGDG